MTIVVHPKTRYPGPTPAMIGWKFRIFGRQIGVCLRVPGFMAVGAMRLLRLRRKGIPR